MSNTSFIKTLYTQNNPLVPLLKINSYRLYSC